MRTRIEIESNLNLWRKDLWLDLRAMQTSLEASCLPQATNAIRSSNIVSGQCNTLVLLQGHSCTILSPRESQLNVWVSMKHAAPQADGELLLGAWWLLPVFTRLQWLIVALLQQANLAPPATQHPVTRFFLKRRTARLQNGLRAEKHVLKVPHFPVSSSMWSWRRYCSFPTCGVAACCKGVGHWRASMVLGRAAAPSGWEWRRVCWAARQLSAALAAVSSIPWQGWQQWTFVASS